jgi:hypothetical protein
MFGGNGHSRGNFGSVNTGDPGKVSVYWAGEKEKEIVDVKEVRCPSSCLFLFFLY